ncbi:MAG: hypothetical protein ABJE77_16465 [Tateyamaria sp.]
MKWTTTFCACAIAALNLTASPSLADGQFAYFLIDDAAGYKVTGREQEAIENATEVLKVTTQLPRRKVGDIGTAFLGASNSAEFLAGSPRDILKGMTVEEFTTAVAPQAVCGDFTELFTTLEYRLLRDQPEAAYIVMSSPMIDIDHSFCDDAKGAPQIPQDPKSEYLLDKILTHPAVKTFIVVGADRQQEQAWFRYIDKIEGAVRPNFVKKEGIRSALVEAAQ